MRLHAAEENCGCRARGAHWVGEAAAARCRCKLTWVQKAWADRLARKHVGRSPTGHVRARLAGASSGDRGHASDVIARWRMGLCQAIGSLLGARALSVMYEACLPVWCVQVAVAN